jgi:hypothetical protein
MQVVKETSPFEVPEDTQNGARAVSTLQDHKVTTPMLLM